MTAATTLAQFDARLRRIELLINSIFLWTESNMTTLQDLQTKIDDLKAQAVDAKADAERQTGLVAQALAALQALGASIAALQAQIANSVPVTQADLDALVAQADAAMTDLTTANATRDAADAALATGVAGAAGAPAPAPPPPVDEPPPVDPAPVP